MSTFLGMLAFYAIFLILNLQAYALGLRHEEINIIRKNKKPKRKWKESELAVKNSKWMQNIINKKK